MIFGLPIDGMPVLGFTDSSTNGLENEFMTQFGIVPTAADHKLLLLFGTNLFCDKSGMTIHWKILPLLRNFSDIRGFSWGSACLAHLYMALCRTSRYDCKKVDGPLALLCIWAWERLLFLASVRSHRSFSLACR
ncbi:hypothetical protein Ahy_B01g055974 isoform B [Arachis hypogaea]|uniref:Aminotransferase-like plant mobile domain-containing protein n=1 Tax=Arachis hypogaea TaxID=3818 RepID=A0A445AXM0_ARAHY|nr:hypothetical protein Ahy_B01g055974 isoform B [Arachis hypogaea]